MQGIFSLKLLLNIKITAIAITLIRTIHIISTTDTAVNFSTLLMVWT